jgi:hypothetical protein
LTIPSFTPAPSAGSDGSVRHGFAP